MTVLLLFFILSPIIIIISIYIFLSSLPNRTKRSLIYSQTLRIGSICTTEGDFNWHAIEMKAWFADIQYPD